MYLTERRIVVIAVTDAAAARLHEMTDAGPEGKKLRLGKEGARLEFKWDDEKPGDQTVSHDETTVLVYDEHIAGLLSGRTLDVKQTENGPALMLT
jgi:Fe-S cluster assembly iron-binding protein IscA